MAKHSELALLFDASLSELLELRRRPFTQPAHGLYAQALSFYLQGDLEALARVSRELRGMAGEEVCAELTELRFQIRQRAPKRATLAQLLKLAASAGDWAGEVYFVVGIGYSTLLDHVAAQLAYEKAFLPLEELGAHRKATKALFNHVVCESRIHPEKKLITDYHYLAKRAAKFKEYGTAATCCSNISREYQKLGALEVALRHCNRALRFLKDDVGSLDYFLVVVHRAHLLLEMGRRQEAELDYQAAQAADFPEVREALHVVDALRAGGLPGLKIDRMHLTPTWRERLEDAETAGFAPGLKRLTPLEGKLLQFIAEAPRTKFEIIGHLYSEKAEFKLLEDRFKNLLKRLKQSRPGLVVFESQKYRISDETFLERHWLKKRA